MSTEARRGYDLDRGFGYENLNPRHTYAAYLFDDPKRHEFDLDVLVTEAKRLGRPVRYWWLSDATDLEGTPDRLIVCVHHPSSGEDAGMDLYSKLYAHKITTNGLKAASFEEYVLYSRPIHHLGTISTPEGELIFPNATPPETEPSTDYHSTRELDPIIGLTYGDMQAVALTALGRYLNDAEVGQTTLELQEFLDRKVTQLISGIEQRRELKADSKADPTGERTEVDYLVYYSLGGLAMTRAVSAVAASEKISTALHGLVGRSESEGVTPKEASQARLNDLEIAIESVEAIEFTTEEP